jgi:hypothetical protein
VLANKGKLSSSGDPSSQLSSHFGSYSQVMIDQSLLRTPCPTLSLTLVFTTAFKYTLKPLVVHTLSTLMQLSPNQHSEKAYHGFIVVVSYESTCRCFSELCVVRAINDVDIT